MPTTVPIIATVVPAIAPTASQFSEELKEIKVAESLVSLQEGPSTAQKSYALEIIPETQDSDPEVVLPRVGVGCGHLPYTSVDPNSITYPCSRRLGSTLLSLAYSQFVRSLSRRFWECMYCTIYW